jgi:serine protease
MASPHVAAVAALMKSVYPDLTPEIFDQLLAGGYLTRDIGPVNRDDSYGYGLIDAQKAAAKAKALNDAGASTTPVLEVSPIVLNFGPFSTSTTVTAANVGVGSLSLSSVAVVPPEATWLTVSEAAVDADKLGDYTVSVSRTGLAEGGYSAVVRFTPSTGDPVNLAVAMRVTAAPPAYPDAGYQYVLLVNPDTAKVVAEVRRQPVNGSYSFTFTGVPEGTYQLWTGSDSNNNRLICEEGEACGAYPDADHPASVTVTGNKATLNFDAFYPNDPLVTGLATAGAVPLRPIERPLSP